MTEDQKLELNKQGIDLLKTTGIDGYSGSDNPDDYDKLRRAGYVGFAHFYLKQSWDKTALVNKAKVKVYEELVKIDNQLGTTMSEQLYECVFWLLRLDLVKV